MTSDGSDHNLVKPEGLTEYVILPLIVYPALFCPEPIDVEAEEMSADTEENDEPMEPEETDDQLDDDEKDRILNDDFNLVGRKFKVLHGNGWLVGKILYFNTALNEYKVAFSGGTSDYIESSDVDNVEVMIL